MNMQDVNIELKLELKFELGKDEQELMAFLSREAISSGFIFALHKA